jgi:ABC-2 type transport system ATP-binding protein
MNSRPPEAVGPTTGTALAPPSIIVESVRKDFLLRRTHSLKETVVGRFRGKDVRSTTFQALDDVSFVITEGESVALLGYNGSGKSTMLKLISGVLEPDAGRVLIRGRLAGLIEVGAGFHPDLSGRENVYLNAAILGMKKHEIDARFDDIVEFSGIEEFIDQEVKHYSSGMFMRLAFSVAIHAELDVLLVDEILSVGDAPFRAKCEERIRALAAEGKTMVIVSHDLDLVRDLCERGIVIEKGKQIFDGPVDEAIRYVEH